MNSVYIGNVEIKKTAVLAPMAGVCDYAQRVLAKEHGAALVFGEMASSAGLVYGDKKTPLLLFSGEGEKPFAAQLFGNNPAFMSEAARIVTEGGVANTGEFKTTHPRRPDLLDINAGCPMPKITANGAGSALLREPKLLSEIIKAVVKSTNIPVTVKIRSGWDKNSINAVETAKICEDSGAAAVSVHARTREQMYSGRADWGVIAKVKQAVKIPVIGNGDITTPKECALMYGQTNCDLVMVGRAAWGAPWIFGEIKTYLETGKLPPPVSLEKRLEIMTRHIELLIKDKGENVAMKQARAHVAKYLKGIYGAASYRHMCAGLTAKDDFKRLVEKIILDNKII